MAPPSETYMPPNIDGMQFDSVAKVEGYDSWSPDDLADYFENEGLGEYREVLIYHKIVSYRMIISNI